MTKDLNQRLIARIGKRQGRSTWPRAVSMEPQVRTPIDIVPITQPDEGERRELRPLDALDPNAPSFGPYLFEWQYNVRLEDVNAFRDWLGLYEKPLRELSPKHFRYLGTFEALFGSSSQASVGRYRTLWQHEDLAGTLHLLRSKQDYDESSKTGNQKQFVEEEDYFIKLLRELISFQDTSSSSRNSQLYQLASLGSSSDGGAA